MDYQNPLYAIDFYKVAHKDQYPVGTQIIYSNLTARFSHHAPVLKELYDDTVVCFGIQAYLTKLFTRWQQHFFLRPKDEAIEHYKEVVSRALFTDINVDHLYQLHDLGYLPISVFAVEEGTTVPIGVPIMTIHNTHEDMAWLPGYLETDISNGVWHSITTATIAYHYRKIMEKHYENTKTDPSFIPWQCHDFSARGLVLSEAATMSGMAHMTSFQGTDTVSAIPALELFYGADTETQFIGHSVPATEHSVMSLSIAQLEALGLSKSDAEVVLFRRLLTNVHPTGLVSVVSDTFDFWNTITTIVPALKDVILSRDGKLVIRPDSGDPVLIVCGDPSAPVGSPEHKGALECLWDTFGGTTNEAGYRTLDSHIGMIYGDSITPKRADEILTKLSQKGFAPNNIVFGVGSFTYQYVTRDSFGLAMKATYGIVNNIAYNIEKDPKTDSGGKKSHRGILHVTEDKKLIQESCTPSKQDMLDSNFDSGLLKPVVTNGTIVRYDTIFAIRKRLHNWDCSK